MINHLLYRLAAAAVGSGAAASGSTSTTPASSSDSTVDSANALPSWLLVALLVLVAAVVVAMFLLTFYNLSAPRSTMKNIFDLKWRSPFRRSNRGRHHPATDSADSGRPGASSGSPVPSTTDDRSAATLDPEASPFQVLMGHGTNSRATMLKLLDTLSRSARVGKRTTRTTLAITGFALLGVLVVAVLGLTGPGVRDLRTQIIAGVITLVATIAGFYFGSQTASDGAGTIGSGNSPTTKATFTADPNPQHAFLVEGVAATYQPALTGAPPVTVVLTAGQLPPKLSLNATTGLISGIPDAGVGTAASEYPISLTALYADGTFLSLDVILSVKAAA